MGKYDHSEDVKCLECGDPIEYGRQDKKFCCTECKNRYHNRKLQKTRITKGRVMNALDRNYEILTRLLKLHIKSIDQSEMKDLGFNFDYVTSYCKVRRHDQFSCFDIRYTVVSSRVTAISKIGSVKSKLAENQNVSLNLPDELYNEEII